MDNEVPPITSPKKGRKGRSFKGKQSADPSKTVLESSSIGVTTNNVWSVSQSSTSSATADVSNQPNLSSEDANIATTTNSEEASSCSTSTTTKEDSSDNLLMPPPAQPETAATSHTVAAGNRDETRPDNETIVDGFSICSYQSQEEVLAAVEATGHAFKHKGMDYLLARAAASSPRTPKLPLRDSRSPTGRRRGPKSGSKTPKTPKAPRQGKKKAGKSPLVGEMSQPSPLMSMAGGEPSGSTVTATPMEELSHNGQVASVKKEDVSMLPEMKHSPEQSKPGDIIKKDEPLSEMYHYSKMKLEEMKMEGKVYPEGENKRIKQENNDHKPTDNGKGCGSSSTSHLIEAPLLRPTASKKEYMEQITAGSHLTTSDRSSLYSQQITEATGCRPAYTTASTPTAPFTSTPPIAAGTPPVVSRSNSVHSVTSTSSRRTTPVCTASTSSRENSSRAASRNSERNTSRGSQQLPPSTSTDPYGSPGLPSNSFGQMNAGMLSFGANGLPPSFPYPGSANFTQPPPSFPFGTPPDILSAFPHGSPLAGPQSEALRRMMSGERPGMPPFLRPELLFPTSSAMSNSTLPPNLSGAMIMQQMFGKLTNPESFQQLLYNQQRNASTTATTGASAPPGAVVPPGATGPPGAPLLGPSPFQSVPGGHNTSTSLSENAQKKSGKWCSAHVRIAYQIYNATRSSGSAEAKNGVGVSSDKSTPLQHPLTQPALNHSVSSFTNIHAKEHSPATSHSQHKPSPLPSPNVSSPQQRVDVSSKLNGSNCNSPANFPPTSLPAAKDLASPLPNRNLANGVLTVPSPKDIPWSKVPSTQQHTSSSPQSTPGKRRDRDGLDMRMLNGSSSIANKRPSSTSSQPVHKKRRSRSKSPSSKSRSKYPTTRPSNGLAIERDKFVSGTSSASGMPTQMYGNPHVMNVESKSLPTNGFAPNTADFWNPLAQQRGMDSQRERLYSQLTPLSGIPDRSDMERLHMLERAKVTPLHNPALNGLYPNNSLSSLSSLAGIGGPPPLIPTSQSKASPQHAQSNSTTGDSYRR